MTKDRSGVVWLILGSPLALLILLTVVALLARTAPQTLFDQLREPSTREAIGVSLRTTLISTGLIVVFGGFLALGIARSKPRLAGILELLVTIPAIMPPSVAGIALLLAFGRGGLIPTSAPFTWVAVVIAQVFVATPFFIREAVVAFRAVDSALLEAAKLDGATAGKSATALIVPIAFPFLATGAILAWTRALGEFGATILFAGNLEGETQTMPLAIYLGFESNLDEAKALATILLITAVLILGVLQFAMRKRMAVAH